MCMVDDDCSDEFKRKSVTVLFLLNGIDELIFLGNFCHNHWAIQYWCWVHHHQFRYFNLNLYKNMKSAKANSMLWKGTLVYFTYIYWGRSNVTAPNRIVPIWCGLKIRKIVRFETIWMRKIRIITLTGGVSGLGGSPKNLRLRLKLTSLPLSARKTEAFTFVFNSVSR